jgi:hypothetical protein
VDGGGGYGRKKNRLRIRTYNFPAGLRALLLGTYARIFSHHRWEPAMPDPRHEPETLLAKVLHEIKSATAQIDQRDQVTKFRLSALENSVNDLLRRAGRPSGGNGHDTDARAQAIGLLEFKRDSVQTKHDASLPAPSFSEDQIAEGKLAIAGLRSLMHSTSIDQVPHDQRKALSAFSFGSQGFILAPEMSNEILSCLTDITTIAG